ncbi:putative transposase [Bradyrhizobium diazoefficiens]|uniref:Mutator family transposase n=1 Tax=Bradyrhizobium diazoefficiens TaxID=1355477 RepID=A0A0E4BRU2_9BRAD|nr:putative transposase [Bradyrhizobium diazoefficiens]
MSVQASMKKDLREVYLASNRASAEVAIDVFAEKYGAKYDKAVECLTKDRDAMLAFYEFPAEHWDHLRTTNPIESVFATVRHRTVRTKGSLSSTTAKLMVFKLLFGIIPGADMPHLPDQGLLHIRLWRHYDEVATVNFFIVGADQAFELRRTVTFTFR